MSDFDPLDLDAQRNASEATKARAQLLAQNARDDWQWLMSNKRGRRIARGLLDFTGVHRSSFTGNSATFFNEGQRNVGLQLMAAIMTHAPDQYAVMMRETSTRD